MRSRLATGFERLLIKTTDLCPCCAMAEAVVESSGFCEPCHAATIAERYQERERVEYEARNRGPVVVGPGAAAPSPA